MGIFDSCEAPGSAKKPNRNHLMAGLMCSVQILRIFLDKNAPEYMAGKQKDQENIFSL